LAQVACVDAGAPRDLAQGESNALDMVKRQAKVAG